MTSWKRAAWSHHGARFLIPPLSPFPPPWPGGALQAGRRGATTAGVPAMPTMKKGMPKVSPFAQMLRDKREKLAPGVPLREFCAARGFEAPVIDGMERDRRTAPGTYSALYKLASGYGHAPTDRWTVQLLDAALGRAPTAPRPAKQARAGKSASPARRTSGVRPLARAPRPSAPSPGSRVANPGARKVKA